ADAFGLEEIRTAIPERRAAIKVCGPLASPGVSRAGPPGLPDFRWVDLVQSRDRHGRAPTWLSYCGSSAKNGSRLGLRHSRKRERAHSRSLAKDHFEVGYSARITFPTPN